MPDPDGSARNTWNPNATTITPTNAAITASSLRNPRLWSAEDDEGGDAGEERGREERQAREQVDADRGADELGDVGRHRDQLGLDPEQERDVRRENRSRQTSGRFMPGRDPELGAHRLDQHRHQVRDENDPEEQVAELRPARHVGREVAGIDVGDRGDERRPEERREPAEPRRSPLSERSAARSTAASPGSASSAPTTSEPGGTGCSRRERLSDAGGGVLGAHRRILTHDLGSR